jgi:LacI family transcriptional regulator
MTLSVACVRPPLRDPSYGHRISILEILPWFVLRCGVPQKQSSKPAVTIYEIAAHVGVSPAAVSSALANRGVERRLSEETVRRIREAAAELGYVPNMAGRRLRAHKSATRQFDLAILTSFEAPLPLVNQALLALQRAVDVQSTEYTRFAVAIEMFHAGKLRDKPGLLDTNRYHGVIITNTLPEDDQFLAKARLPYPVVVLGRRIPSYSCVLESPEFVGRRLAAFTRTIRERSGRAPVALASEGLQPREGAATIEAFLARGGKFDGLFAVNDSLAIGAYKAIKHAGLVMPRDVAVVGVGDYELAEYFDPPLTTVAGGNEAMVAEAVPMLFRILRGERDVPREVLVVPPVFLRDSTQRKA